MPGKKIRGIIQIFRPELPLAAGVCVILGEIIALGELPSLRILTLGFMSAFFISGSAIVLNDYFDLEVDRINAPDRPLPAGIISPSEAILITIIATVLGLSASLAVSIPAFVLCLLFWLIGFLYNWRFKSAGLAGNLMVSSSVAITFILGGMMVGEPWNKIVWTFSLMAFFLDLGEEIGGDAMDIEGDKQRKSKSIAIVKGRNFALTLSAFFFALVVLISFIPVVFTWLGTAYLIVISITDLLIITFTVRLLRSKTSAEGRSAMRMIYFSGSLGMLAIFLTRVFA